MATHRNPNDLPAWAAPWSTWIGLQLPLHRREPVAGVATPAPTAPDLAPPLGGIALLARCAQALRPRKARR